MVNSFSYSVTSGVASGVSGVASDTASAGDAGVDIDPSLLAGPSAVAFIKGDPIDAAKSLKNFQKENPFLVIKGGIFEGKSVTVAEIMKLADLESREVLLSKLAGAMKGSLAKAIRTIDALRAKKEALEGAPVVSEAPAAVEVVAEATPEVQAVVETIEAEAPADVVAEATPETPEATPEVTE